LQTFALLVLELQQRSDVSVAVVCPTQLDSRDLQTELMDALPPSLRITFVASDRMRFRSIANNRPIRIHFFPAEHRGFDARLIFSFGVEFRSQMFLEQILPLLMITHTRSFAITPGDYTEGLFVVHSIPELIAEIIEPDKENHRPAN
jgi:hypothetical protein